MGQAKRRGTYKQRVEQAQLAQQIIEKAFTNKKVAQLILVQKFNGDKKAFVNDIVRRALERKRIDEAAQIPDTSSD